MQKKYVIEARSADGSLDLSGPQAHEVFGDEAIHGISENRMADIIFRRVPDATLYGDGVEMWPSLIDPRFRARIKYW